MRLVQVVHLLQPYLRPAELHLGRQVLDVYGQRMKIYELLQSSTRDWQRDTQ